MSAKNQIVKIGICGLGRSGYGIHCKALKDMGDNFTVHGVYDPIAERKNAVAEEFGAKSYADYATMLVDPEVDLVIVASPNKYHAAHAIQALKAGKHVLCEKPFGLTVDDVDAMIAASEENSCVLQPFQQRRYEEDFCKVKEICESGLLGEIQFIRICWHGFKRRWDWQTMRTHAGGALNNNGPHPIDHALELFGDAEPEVWAEARRCLCSGDAEDYIKIIMTAPGHPTVEIELDDITAYPQDRWFVCGTKGGLHGGTARLDWKYVDWSVMPERPVCPAPTPDRSYNNENLDWQEDCWSPAVASDSGAGAAPAQQPVFDLYSGMYDAIVNSEPQQITPQQVRKRIRILEKVREFTGIPALI